MKAIEYFRDHYLAAPKLELLPEAVQESIRHRDWRNEILLRSIQLGVILIFCLIYAISPKTHPEGVFVPTPYVLSTYLILSLIGLAWILLREPPDWAVYASILFDFGLLYGLMIGFHIQYEQPPSFILKAPALLYVFIFISIRALRFHARFVLAAGGVAIAGWAAVILYVANADPHDNMLTRSYVEYLTSNSILIGAEVDKIISILFVTCILAIAVNGSKNLLVTAIAEQAAAKDFSKFFDQSVAAGIRRKRLKLEAGHGEKKSASIMNIDIRGFTKMAANMDPSEVMRFLSAYQGRIIPVIRQHGGVVDKFMGDGVMATFGTDDEKGDGRENHAVRALEAAAQLLQEAPKWKEEETILAEHGTPEIGIGIASGDIAFGAVGHGERLEITVIGAAVNLSAKLEKHNKAVGSNCLCDLATWEAVKANQESPPLAGEAVEGKIEGAKQETTAIRLTLPK